VSRQERCGLLAGCSGKAPSKADALTPEDKARIQANNIAKALAACATGHDGEWPKDLADLTTRATGSKGNAVGPFPGRENLVDPWGKRYLVDRSGKHPDGHEPDVFTVSPGGKTIGNWNPFSRGGSP
jgi:hypothetical protein